MDPTMWLIGIVTVLVLYYLLKRGDNSYPPGPFVFPVIGNLPQLLMIGSLHKFAEHYRKQYGNVFSFGVPGRRRVVVSGYDTVRTLLIKNADYTSNRSTGIMMPHNKNDVTETPGFVWAPYPQWKTLRSFTISTLREQGMGKSALEHEILEEVDAFMEHFIQPNLEKPFSIFHNLSQATANVLSQMVFARRFSYDDEEFKALTVAIDKTMKQGLKVSMINSIPFGSYFIKYLLKEEKLTTQNTITPTLMSYMEENKRTIDMDNPRNVLDRYIIHRETVKGEEEKFYSDQNGLHVARQLYIAGTDTTAASLQWALLYMCLHPEIKGKVQREIDDVIGSSRPVTCKDRVNMPYTDAVLLEILRKANVAPAALPHTADQELVVDGVRIPAGADLMINMASVLYDEKVFEEPEKFKPERYLTGDIALKKQRTIPFGIGRRSCPGEGLVKMTFFIFFVTLLQRLDISLPDGVTMTDDASPNDGLVRSPNPYELVFTARN